MTALLATMVGAWLALGVPPLSEAQQARLSGAVDGADHREDAFLALIENVRDWDGGRGDTHIRLQIDIQSLLSNPSAMRGEMFRVSGVLQQQTPLAPPYESVSEWFLRLPDGKPAIVYIVGNAMELRIGGAVEVDARFYKRADFVARDGRRHAYAAFVGAHPRVTAVSNQPAAGKAASYERVSLIAIAVASLMLVFVAIRAYIRRQQKAATRATRLLSTPTGPGVVDEAADLPDDPAAALAELRRRAQES